MKQRPQRYSAQHNSPLNLPKIKQHKKDVLQDLVQKMRIRKRMHGGGYNEYENGNIVP